MGNIHDYLKWRGDLSFTEYPFCEADNLALAALSYIKFDNILTDNTDKLSLCKAYDVYKNNADNENGLYHYEDYKTLFALLAKSKRFKDSILSNYRSVLDEITSTQFAALEILLGDETSYIAFRGTDDSIIGWKEDFYSGCQVVEAQILALNYAEDVIYRDRKYRLGGHSKGGNLAMYAAIYCNKECQEQIITVFNNDGPGFAEEIVPSNALATIEEKLIWIVPEYSLIGTLFLKTEPSKIILSNETGILQHDFYSWQIEGENFCQVNSLCSNCKFYADTLNGWISSISIEERMQAINDLFNAMNASGAKTMNEFISTGNEVFETLLMSVIHSESKTKIAIVKLIKSFVSSCKSISLTELIKTQGMIKAIAFLFVGLLLVILPDVAMRFAGTSLGLIIMIVSGKQILDISVNTGMNPAKRKFSITIRMIVICAIEFGSEHENVVK